MREVITIAMILGFALMGTAGLAALFFGWLALVAWFPIRLQWTIKPPSYIKTPTQVQNIDSLIGLSNRGGGRMWFAGLMTVSPGQEPKIVNPVKAHPSKSIRGGE